MDFRRQILEGRIQTAACRLSGQPLPRILILIGESSQDTSRHDFCSAAAMNPKAEALKDRTKKFALDVLTLVDSLVPGPSACACSMRRIS